MPIYKLDESTNKFFHVLVTHPRWDILSTNLSSSANVSVINGYPTEFEFSGSLTGSSYLRVEELNNPGVNIYPYIVKGSSRQTYRTITTTDFDNTFSYGDRVTGSYDNKSTIRTSLITPSNTRELSALRNMLDYQSVRNPNFAISSSQFDKFQQTIRLIKIPSLFFGSSIERGTVELKITRRNAYDATTFGEKSIAILRDDKQNGELIQRFDSSLVEASSSYDNKVGGVVLYRAGFILLTGSWALTDNEMPGDFTEIVPNESTPRWYHFGEPQSDDDYFYTLKFNGTSKTPVRTIFADAPMGELNNSSNPTFISYGQNPSYGIFSGSFGRSLASNFYESDKILIANTRGDPYSEVEFTKSNVAVTGSNFTKQTFLSKIVLLDEKKIPIAVVKLANLLRHREKDDLNIKIKLDI